MYIKEKQQVFKEVVVACKCDECGARVDGDSAPDGWHSFNSRHHEWGNDSIDSYEYWLVCSAECYAAVLGKLVSANKSRRSFEVDEMNLAFANKLIDKLKP